MASAVLKMCNVFKLKTEEILCGHFSHKYETYMAKRPRGSTHKIIFTNVAVKERSSGDIYIYFLEVGERKRGKRDYERRWEERQWGDDQLSAYHLLGVSPAPCWMCLIGRPVWIGSCPGCWTLKAGAALRGRWSGSLYSSVLKSSLSPLCAWACTAK